MKTIIRNIKLISVVLFLFLGTHGYAKDHGYAKEIASGSYTLEFTIPAMAEGKKQTKLSGELKSRGDTFTFKTKGAMGNLVIIHGYLTSGRVLMFMSKEEKGNVLTFHFTGELPKENDALWSGEASLYTTHDKSATGNWKLRSNK